MTSSDARTARLRRLDDAMETVRSAVASGSPHECPDAVAVGLDVLYDLWEFWTKRLHLTNLADEDSHVSGVLDGEVAAALVFARGGKTHDLVEFGHLTDTFSDIYSDIYGSWRWQQYHDGTPRYAQRDGWYASHVAGQEVLPIMERAVAWLRQQV